MPKPMNADSVFFLREKTWILHRNQDGELYGFSYMADSRMAANGDDGLLIPDSIDIEMDDWEW